MKKTVAFLLGFAATAIVGVDVAGLAGAFAEPKFDAAASTIPKGTPSALGSNRTASTPPPQAHSAGASSRGAGTDATKPSSSGTKPSSIFRIPPAVPVPAGAIPTAPIGNGADVTTIGDSVMVDAEPYLVQLLPGIVVDGKVSRQLIKTPPVVAALKAEGELHRYVVIELGTNGPFTASQLRTLMHQVGPHRGFVLVNTSEPRPWEQVVNQVIDQVAATYPHTVLVNWYQAAQNIPQDFYPDQVHLMPAGAKYYATLIAEAVLKLEREYPPLSQAPAKGVADDDDGTRSG